MRSLGSLSLIFLLSWIRIGHGFIIPAEQVDDQTLAEEYANLKQILINDLGYTKEFADKVELNLKRAIREEKARQQLQGVVPTRLRQQASEEEYDEETTSPGPTTPGPQPGDIVRGVAGILTSLGTFNVGNFWSSFVNFFPPNDREGAQALVDASLGRRPAKWPTIPTTTTKLTTTTKDEDEIDSEETTTKPATATAAAVPAGATAAPATASVTSASVVAATAAAVAEPVASQTEAATRAPVSRYTIRPRTASPNGVLLRNSESIQEKVVSESSTASVMQ